LQTVQGSKKGDSGRNEKDGEVLQEFPVSDSSRRYLPQMLFA
jgi:hypothetical protein